MLRILTRYTSIFQKHLRHLVLVTSVSENTHKNKLSFHPMKTQCKLQVSIHLGHTQPPIQRAQVSLTPEIKRPGREANHSSPSSAEVRNAWIFASTPQYVFMAWCLIKQELHFHGIVLS